MENGLIEFEYFIKKLGKDTLTYVPAKLIPGTITIISVAIFTRIFNPSDYGMYILVITTTMILTAIFSQWITQSILRYRAQYILKTKTSVFNKNIFSILLLLSIVICLFAGCFYPFSKILGNYQRFYIISILIIISGIWFNNLVAVFQSDLKSSLFSLYTIINAILKFALALLLILFITKNIIALLWGIFPASLIVIIPMVVTLIHNKHGGMPLKNTPNNVVKPLFPFLKQFLIYGFPMIGWFLGAQLLSISDRYFLQIFRGSEDVGIYSSNYNLVASAMSFISMPLLTAAHPLLMKAGTSVYNKKEEIQKLIRVFSRYFLIIAFPVMVYVMVLFKELADIFLGVEYRQGSVVLPIVLCGLFAWYFAMVGHKGLEIREKTSIMFMYVMICTAVKIILNILFIPRYGYSAAAVTTLICFLMYPILVYFGTKSDIKWDIPWSSVLRIGLASIILAMVFIVIKQLLHSSFFSLLVASVVMFPTYFVGLYLFGEFKTYEISYLRAFLGKMLK